MMKYLKFFWPALFSFLSIWALYKLVGASFFDRAMDAGDIIIAFGLCSLGCAHIAISELKDVLEELKK